MNLTKKEQAEASEVYETWLNSYLNGDVKTYDSYFDDRYRFIGSTSNEDFLNRNDTTRFFEVTADQLAGKVEIRNNRRTLEKFDELIFITDLFDAYFLNGNNWEYYEKFRFTSILKKTNDDWRFVYQHFSTPDSKAQEGETIGTEQIAAENLMLREAVKRRTTELEQKNRELAIEAATERVRTQAMAMQHPDDLDRVNKEILNQLNLLQIPGLTGVTFYLVNENGWVNAWDFSSPGNMGNQNSYSLQFDFKKYEMMGEPFQILLQTDLNYFVADYPLEKLKKAVYELEEINPAVASVFREALAGGALTHQWTACARISNGLLGVDLVIPPSGDTKTIVLKMAAAFNQAYTRFLDLQKAESQAREAQIEAALERVRSRTMGMRYSRDLQEVVSVLYEQLDALGLADWGCSIMIFDENANRIENWVAEATGSDLNCYIVEGHRHPVYEKLWQYWKQQGQPMMLHHTDEVKWDFDKYWLYETGFKALPEEVKRSVLNEREVFLYYTSMSHGLLSAAGYVELPDEKVAILQRFAKVFNQTYTRFIDLQKAEAQARESQIQLALERVRARTMAMQRSEELADVALVLFQQVKQLGIETWSTGFNVWLEGETSYIDWVVSTAEGRFMEPYTVDLTAHPFFLEISKAKKRGDDFFMIEAEGETLAETYRLLFKMAKIQFEDLLNAGFQMPEHQINHYVFGKQVSLMFITFDPCPEAHDIFKRLGKAFEQTYTRFLDLQKAEAQAREAQNELALERVRARAMAMQSSDELRETVLVINEQLHQLGFEPKACNIIIIDKDTGNSQYWVSGFSKDIYPVSYHVPYLEHPYYEALLQPWRQGKQYLVYEYTEEKKPGFDEIFFVKTEFRNMPDEVKELMIGLKTVKLSTAYFSHGAIQVLGSDALSEEKAIILKRFTKVFEQTYTRFLDLQKAEAQAREAQIEAALEKVRSRSLAMHTPNELGEVVTVIVEKLTDLGVVLDANGVVLCTYFADSKDVLHWIVSPDFKMAGSYLLPWFDHPIFREAWESKESGDTYFSKAYSIEDKNSFFEYAFEHSDYRYFPEDFKQWVFQNDKHILSFAWQKNSAILIPSHTGVVPTEYEAAILKRFAKVFEQAYTRFLDLQKVEAQAREAQIEAALERVRSKAMSMHNSEDLAATIGAFYRELEQFSITPRRCGVGLLQKNRLAELSTMNTVEQGNSIEIIGKLKMEGHWVLDGVYDNWILQKEFHPVLRGNEIKEYNQLLRPQIAFPEYPNNLVQYGYFFFFPEGGVYAWTEKEMKEDELKIYRRFTTVLSLTYKRYKDLKDAEANAREAVRRASLDRVRAEIASMRTMDDLQRITPIIWHELTVLGVPFVRCGVFIMNEMTEHVQVYLSTPDGRSLAVLDLPFNSSELTLNSVNHWRQGIIFKTHWNKQEFLNFMQSMIKLGQVSNQKTYQGAAEPPESLDLHFVPFKQGMLYVGNTSSLEKEALELVKSLAESFSIAYARYEDFRQLESAKNQIEKTFTDLKAAQAQLIQAEKMASLGELTAGIAHEIQNPLNFVNNFSEISNELVEELKGERIKDKGERDEELEGELLNDISQNLEKINHHGKRAADIVKGMLQHSRTSSGVKEPTDINALADEYLRLAYHGLRAKDKSFNAKMNTNFDETIGKINVIPQDIGRVILNLITNAFYVVDEKKKRLKDGYEPIVSVSTKRIDNQIFISVKDNGNGIPKHILDKIFQPFFTTKPTGQGTGLGLSLSYDIVKAHGGTISVESTENEGSEFIIQIPFS
jgi:signal transduction histidine kinase/ketosteroid isomerase-like protein